MKQETLEFVRSLSLNDPKTLSQKGLKLSEECGELAKKILPYESASGTLHRVVTKEQILEESADSILVALSVAYSLGYTDADITAMMDKKALYWMQLQQTQGKVDLNKIPHEIHLTIENVEDVEEFRNLCLSFNGLKPVVLNLHMRRSDEVRLEMMTSRIFIGSTADAIAEMNTDADRLTRYGYKVIRQKIEAAPWHPAVPRTNAVEPAPGMYFEVHIEVAVDDNDENRNFKALKDYLEWNQPDMVLSTNIYKKPDNGIRKVMATFRTSGTTLEEFTKMSNWRRSQLEKAGWLIDQKQLIEYAILDTNEDYDRPWLQI